MLRICVIVASAAILAGCNATTNDRSLTALSGATIEVDVFYTNNIDCSSNGVPAIRVTRPPANGRAFSSTVSDFPNYRKENPRQRCNTRRVPGTKISYSPRRGFLGEDSFTYDIFWYDGEVWTRNVKVNVR